MRRIKRWIDWLSERTVLEHRDLEGWIGRRAVYCAPEEYDILEDGIRIGPHDRLIEPGHTLFMELHAVIPQEWSNGSVALLFTAGGEGHLTLGGLPYHGLDMNRTSIPLPEACREALLLDQSAVYALDCSGADLGKIQMIGQSHIDVAWLKQQSQRACRTIGAIISRKRPSRSRCCYMATVTAAGV